MSSELQRTLRSTGKELLTRLTWSRNHTGASLSVKPPLGCLRHVLRLGSYLVAVADTELGLLLDDMCAEFMRRTFEGTVPPPITAECLVMIEKDGARAAQCQRVRRGVSACGAASARTPPRPRWAATGGDDASGEGSELSIFVDEKKVVDVQRLEWIELPRESGDSCGWVDGRRDVRRTRLVVRQR
ncbi:hypothetical protein Cni_G28814 [Canna indica]|uniref:Uncharacterized protein n=1 Tax=Canna indica TaxID=4628 RepID=A0AAQ3LAF5_9LILI|nr:hypothetical protein Cni_G28814 [Canna indica]